MSASDVSAIVLNYNGGAQAVECVRSLLDQAGETIVVDNGSSDGSAELLERAFGDRIRLRRLEENVGISRARNLGARLAGNPVLLFLDNDAVACDGMAKRLRAALAADSSIGIAGAVTLDALNREVVQLSAPTIDRWGFAFDATTGLRAKDLPAQRERDVFYVPGISAMIAAQTFHAIGGYDDDMFFGCEDVDICWRAWLCGYRVVSVRDATCMHRGGGSIGFALEGSLYTPSLRRGGYRTSAYRIASREANTFRMMLVNLGLGNLVLYLALCVPTLLMELFAVCAIGRWNIARAYLSAFARMIAGFPGALARRRTVQTLRRTPDAAIVRLWSRGYNKLRFLRANGVPKTLAIWR